MSKEETGINLTVRFWTDYGKDKNGETIHYKKKAFGAGTIYLRASSFHGIKADQPIPFNNLEEFFTKLDALFKKHKIEIVIRAQDGSLTPRLGKGYPKGTWTGKYE